MKRFSYLYECAIAFSAPVTCHSYHLRCLPRAEQFQRIAKEGFRIEAELPDGTKVPAEAVHGEDAFGGKVRAGCFRAAHCVLRFVAEGEVVQSSYRICGTVHGMYRADTPLTASDAAMRGFAMASGALADGTATERALRLCSAVHERMNYAPGSTNVSTTAAQAFASGLGVCQDYAHITVALLRYAGIPARYVCGFLSGEGATHAWVEYFDSGVWLALDPTHGRAVTHGCIKVAHGRDSSDCAVNRGVFTGRAVQNTAVSIKVDLL